MSEQRFWPPNTTVKLNSGNEMPAIGLGCWSGVTPEENKSGQAWFRTALDAGYRHFDTAYGYGTEPYVAGALRESGVRREEVWVTTKLPNHHHHKVAESLQESLDRAGFEYYDLYLIHFPQAQPDIAQPRLPGPNGEPGEGDWIVDPSITVNDTWAQMEKLLATGKVRQIGVSNFSVKNLKKLLETANVVPAVNQVEMHPHLSQPELLAFCQEKGITLTAYSPTGYSQVANDPTIVSLASKYSVSSVQIALAWHLARGTIAIPKSTNLDRQKANLYELPILDPEDVALIDTLNKRTHYCFAPGPRGKVFGLTYEEMGWEGDVAGY